MPETTNLSISLVEQNQSQKEVTVNEAISVIDAIMNCGAISNNVNTPPDSPVPGSVYIIGNNASGEWENHNYQIAYFQGIWKFIQPNEGISLWVNDEDCLYVFDGTEWRTLLTSGGNNSPDLEDFYFTDLAKNDVLQYTGSSFINKPYISNIPSVSVNTDLDANNKLSVRSNSVLFASESDNIRVNINKNSENSVSSVIFSDNFSAKAEFGLIGDNDLQFKVSFDGENFYQSFVIDNENGDITFKNNLKAEGNLSNATFKNCSQAFNINDNSGSSTALDLSLGSIQEIILTNDCQISFPSDIESGKAVSFYLILKQDSIGNRVVTWPLGVKWANRTVPSLSKNANEIDIFKFLTTDTGNNWYGFSVGLDMG